MTGTPKAIMNIIVNEDGTVDFRSDARNEDMLQLLGAIEMAAKRMKEDISKMYSTYQKSPVKQSELTKRIKLPKDDAMKAYMKAGQKIQDRLLEMNSCDERAVFEVPQDLLQVL